MTQHARRTGLILVLACAAGACAAPGYNPPDRPRAAEACPMNEVWVCTDRNPSRLERNNEPPMICTCEHLGGIH